MSDLQKYKAKICYTAAGHLIVDNKILLIKHKKLQSWMSPGGHIEDNELPHQAAEREFFEETGVKVRTKATLPQLNDYEGAEMLPQPLLLSLHWVSQANYDARKANKQSGGDNPWSNGCEQHLGFVYLMESVDTVDFYQNLEETDGIAWFTLEEIATIEMLDNIKSEIEYAFNSV